MRGWTWHRAVAALVITFVTAQRLHLSAAKQRRLTGWLVDALYHEGLVTSSCLCHATHSCMEHQSIVDVGRARIRQLDLIDFSQTAVAEIEARIHWQKLINGWE